jgi:hypothetical protein
MILLGFLFLFQIGNGFAGKGVHELQEASILPKTSLTGIPEIPEIKEVGLYPSLETLALQAILVFFALAYAGRSAWKGQKKTSYTQLKIRKNTGFKTRKKHKSASNAFNTACPFFLLSEMQQHTIRVRPKNEQPAFHTFHSKAFRFHQMPLEFEEQKTWKE